MEVVKISKDVLEQMDRQITFAYTLVGIVTTLAFFIVGYQIYINSKTIAKLKKENEQMVKKMLKPLFISQIASIMDFSPRENEKTTRSLLDLYPKYFSEDQEVTESVTKKYYELRGGKISMYFEPFLNMGVKDSYGKLLMPYEVKAHMTTKELNDFLYKHMENLDESWVKILTDNIKQIEEYDRYFETVFFISKVNK